MARARDSQRSKVYAAERAAFIEGRGPDAPAAFGRHNLTLPEAQAYVDKVIGSAWFARQFDQRGKPWIRVVSQRSGGGWSSGGLRGGTITVSRWGRREVVLLHEIAHNVVTATVLDAPWHGWEFCEVMLKLVQHHLGVDAAKALKAQYRAHKVKFAKPRPKRQLSPEQAEANRARLAAYRDRKAAERAAAAAADPMKVELIKKGNFSAKHTWGVEFVVVDLDTEEIMIKRSQMQAGDARSYGMSMVKQFAEERPGHDMELVITGFSKRHGEDMPDRSEIHRVRYEPELVMA